jgi:hypothetical protein
MLHFKDLISEKFELPPDLQKQLEKTAYSALGHIASHWAYSLTFMHLKKLYDLDRPKFDRYMTELYKLIFP